MIKRLLKIAQKVRRFYWWIVRPTTRGVRAIVLNRGGKILLVQHKYQAGWFFPGGTAGKNEKDEDALRRELREELGIHEIPQLEKFGEYTNIYEYKKDTIAVFVVRSFAQKSRGHFEIEKQEFFDPRVLPDGVSPGTMRRIEEWLGQKTVNNQW